MRRLVSLELSDRFFRGLFTVAAVSAVGLSLASISPASAQSGDVRDQTKQSSPPPSDTPRDSQREFVEAAQAINGPAGNPECVWLGRRVVGLMKRDDLDTAFRHLDLYDRFGCPGGHIQATFRCLIKFPEPKPPETLNGQVHTCWVNPAAQPASAAAPAAAAAPAPAPPPAQPAK